MGDALAPRFLSFLNPGNRSHYSRAMRTHGVPRYLLFVFLGGNSVDRKVDGVRNVYIGIRYAVWSNMYCRLRSDKKGRGLRSLMMQRRFATGYTSIERSARLKAIDAESKIGFDGTSSLLWMSCVLLYYRNPGELHRTTKGEPMGHAGNMQCVGLVITTYILERYHSFLIRSPNQNSAVYDGRVPSLSSLNSVDMHPS